MASTGSVVVPEPKTKKSLVWLGGALIALFVVGALLGRYVGSETKEVTTPTTATSGAAITQATEKRTTTKSWPSDTLLTAVLASGAVLVVVGLLYNRISAVKIPGGAEITLTQEEKDKVAEKVAEKVNAGDVAPEQAPAVTMVALERLAVQKQALLAPELPEDVVGAAVDSAASQ